jgi:hypothetical protein
MVGEALSEDVSDVSRDWCTKLLQKLYKERPRFCDIAIKCVDDTLFAHRAVLAARTPCGPIPLAIFTGLHCTTSFRVPVAAENRTIVSIFNKYYDAFSALRMRDGLVERAMTAPG